MHLNLKLCTFFWSLAFLIFAAADPIVKIFIIQPFRNYGFVFSIPFPAWLLYLIYTVVLIPLVFYFFKHRTQFSFWETLGWVLIFGGSASNILERIHLGYVRDFIYVPGGSVINIADILITIGLILLFIIRKKD